MSVDPTISIIIPVYNVEPYIDECICSVLEQQGDTPLELILVDDCGEDNSMDIVRERVSNLPPHLTATILQHKKNRGLSAARNTGTAAARGEYILYLDSDDALLPTAISTLLQEAQKSGADITIGGLTLTSPDDRDFFVTKQGEWKGSECVQAIFSYTIQPMAWNKLIKREFLLRTGIHFREGLLHEDELWIAQIALTHPHIYATNQPTYRYRNKRSGSIMATLGLKHTLSKLIIVRTIAPLLAAEEPEARQTAQTWLLNHALRNLLDFIDSDSAHENSISRHDLYSTCQIIAQNCTPYQQNCLKYAPNLRSRRVAWICRKFPAILQPIALYIYLRRALTNAAKRG